MCYSTAARLTAAGGVHAETCVDQACRRGIEDLDANRQELREVPSTLPHVRFQAHHLLDLGLTKNIRFGNRVRVQVRIEALNVDNFTLFGIGNLTTTSNNATFGRLSNIDTSTVMKPRDVQLGVRVTF